MKTAFKSLHRLPWVGSVNSPIWQVVVRDDPLPNVRNAAHCGLSWHRTPPAADADKRKITTTLREAASLHVADDDDLDRRMDLRVTAKAKNFNIEA